MGQRQVVSNDFEIYITTMQCDAMRSYQIEIIKISAEYCKTVYKPQLLYAVRSSVKERAAEMPARKLWDLGDNDKSQQ